MSRKKITILLVAVSLVFSIAPYMADAAGYKKCGSCKKGLDEKICAKVKFMLKNEEALDLSEAQVAKIKEIKYATKREMVKQKAEIWLVKIDIKEKLYQEKVDVAAIDPLIDKKYDLKKAKAKYLVQQYADLKAVLSPEQYQEMKKLWYKAESAACKR